MKTLLALCLICPLFALAGSEEIRGSRAALTNFEERVIVDQCITLWHTGDVDKIIKEVGDTAKEISNEKNKGVTLQRIDELEAKLSESSELLERLLSPFFTSEKWEQNLYWKIPGNAFGMKEGEDTLKLQAKLQIRSLKLAGKSREDLLEKIEVNNVGTGFVLILEKRASTSELCNLEQTMIVDVVVTTTINKTKKKFEFELTQTGGGWSDQKYRPSQADLEGIQKALKSREIDPGFNPRSPEIYEH
jgi:hypothetical protein